MSSSNTATAAALVAAAAATAAAAAASSQPTHALQTPFAFWYDRKINKKTGTAMYMDKMQLLGKFSTIEDFWTLYIHLKRPSMLDNNINLYLFRYDEAKSETQNTPAWETYPRGGIWILKIKKKERGPSVLGKMWQDMVLAIVGEMFEEPSVVGISVCIRKAEDLISVWNSDNRNEEIRFRIGEKMKEILDLEPSCVVEYKENAKSMQDLSSFKNAKAYVFAAAAGAAAANSSPSSSAATSRGAQEGP